MYVYMKMAIYIYYKKRVVCCIVGTEPRHTSVLSFVIFFNILFFFFYISMCKQRIDDCVNGCNIEIGFLYNIFRPSISTFTCHYCHEHHIYKSIATVLCFVVFRRSHGRMSFGFFQNSKWKKIMKNFFFFC